MQIDPENAVQCTNEDRVVVSACVHFSLKRCKPRGQGMDCGVHINPTRIAEKFNGA